MERSTSFSKMLSLPLAFSCYPSLFDGVADRGFISIRSCGINQTVACAERFGDASLALFGIRYLKHAES
jgi:hypothetical protein